MSNVIARKIEVTAEYQPLAAQQTVATVTVSAPPANVADVCLLGDTGDDVPLAPGEWHTFRSVDLADIVTVVGGTW